MENINSEKIAKEIIEGVNSGSFYVEPFLEEKGIDQSILKEACSIIKNEYPDFVIETAEDGNIYRIFRRRFN